MSDFSTAATVELVLPDSEVRNVRQQIESGIGQTEVGVTDGGTASAQMAGGGRNSRQRRRERRTFRLDQQRNEHLADTVAFLEDIEDKVGSDGGGGGIFGGLLDTVGDGAGGIIGGGALTGAATALGGAATSLTGAAAALAGAAGTIAATELLTEVNLDVPDSGLPLDTPESGIPVDAPEKIPVEDPGNDGPFGILRDPPQIPFAPTPGPIPIGPVPGPIPVQDPSPLSVATEEPLEVETVEAIPVDAPDSIPLVRATETSRNTTIETETDSRPPPNSGSNKIIPGNNPFGQSIDAIGKSLNLEIDSGEEAADELADIPQSGFNVFSQFTGALAGDQGPSSGSGGGGGGGGGGSSGNGLIGGGITQVRNDITANTRFDVSVEIDSRSFQSDLDELQREIERKINDVESELRSEIQRVEDDIRR